MKKINRIIVLFIAFVFLFSNCEKDDINIHSSADSSSLKLSILGKNEINFNIKLKEKLEEIQSKQNEFQLKSQNSDFDFLIITDGVILIEKEDYFSYTFPIIKKSFSDKKLKNLVLEVNENGGYDAFIVSYDFTAKELEKLSEKDLKSKKVSIKNIDFDFSNVIPKCGGTCIEYYSLEMIDEGDKGELVGAENVENPTYAWVYHKACTGCGGDGLPTGGDPTDPLNGGSGDNPGGIGDDTYTTPVVPDDGYTIVEAFYNYEGMYLNSYQRDWIINHQEQALLILNEVLENKTYTLPPISLTLEMIDILRSNISEDEKIESIAEKLGIIEPELNFTQVSEYKNEILRMTAWLKVRGSRPFGEFIESLTNDFNSMTIGDVQDIYKVTRKEYLRLKALYIIVVIRPVAKAVKPFIELALIELTAPAAISVLAKIPLSFVTRGAKVEQMILETTKLGEAGVMNSRLIYGTSEAKADALFAKLTQDAISVSPAAKNPSVIVAQMGNNMKIILRPMSTTVPEAIRVIEYQNFNTLLGADSYTLKFIP